MTTNLRARFDGNVLVPIGHVDLPKDRDLEIQVIDVSSPGSPEAIAALLDRLPRSSAEDVEALERAIEEGKAPPIEGGVFDDYDDEPSA